MGALFYMQQTFYVYVHTNKINNKKYFGITSRIPQKRWGVNGYGYLRKDVNGKYSQEVFARAIEKYGWDNFEHTVLYEGLTENDAKQKEMELIAQYHTYIGDTECCGYNLTRGGDGHLRYTSKEAATEANKKCIKYWIARMQQDPELHAKKLAQLHKTQHKRKIDPEKHEKDLAAARNTKRKVAILRQELFTLYEKFPKYFTEEQRHLIFDRAEATQTKKNFCCYSYKKLYEIFINILERLPANERTNYDNFEII